MIRTLFLAVAIAAAPLPALAHKVIMGVFASGDQIEGELGFSGGDAPAGQLVEVFDGDGNKLGEAVTDVDGFFLFTPEQAVIHVFKADMGAGHVAEVEMAAEEVTEIVAKGAGATPGAAATIGWSGNEGNVQPLVPAAGGTSTETPAIPTDPTEAIPAVIPQVTVASLTSEEVEAIAKAVRDEMRPLRKSIDSYKEKNDLQTILGGIGYIVGVFGVGFYIAARRKLKGTA
ncbi:cobalt ABC transporter permease [Tropicimonas sp. TH_r6]|uniref:cobalt ABC transporter permease n=1 Tax=Tropicimonas sp. TH_r6 TaxID=3082085 RepID=UPI002954E061|nr:cobalt ABC transporter permease [Tropicimonas sp. TH_r6]MDV7143072.1 cobalt ABC transporter permease [Tropicimonas sp. TH_r6]